MKNCRYGLFDLCCAVLIFAALILVSNSTVAQTPTTTHLRCFYQNDPSHLKPDTSWVWAIDPVTIERAKQDPGSFDLNAFKKAHPTAPDPRPLINIQKWNPNKTNYPHSPYTNLSLHDPATTEPFDDTDMEKIQGYWYSRPYILGNLFYSETQQQDFVQICNLSLALQGIKAPVAMYSASWNYFSYDYMIWTIDSANQNEKINKIVSFGDSVSDIQNMFNGTYWWLPTQYNYFIGRFSNGKNWLDYLSVELNLPLYDWAIGGAASQSVYHGLLPGVIYQVKSFIDYTQNAPEYAKNYQPEHTLFTLLIGANDLISYGLSGDQIYENVLSALSNLIVNGGARNIMLVNLPDISRAPIFLFDSQQGNKEKVHAEVLRYNTRLEHFLVKDILKSLGGSASRIDASELNIQMYDAFKLVNSFIDNHDYYGISNATNACLNLTADSVSNYTTQRLPSLGCATAPNKADSYLFWDLLHPTTHTHKLLADYAFCFIEDKFGDVLNERRPCKITNPN